MHATVLGGHSFVLEADGSPRVDADGKALVSPTGPAEATVTATANDHVAMLLGRTPATAPDVAGDREAAAVYLGRIVGP